MTGGPARERGWASRCCGVMQAPQGRNYPYSYNGAPHSYSGALFVKRRRASPASWRWPALWAFVVGFVVQVLFGVLPSMASGLLLLAADPSRCPLALGATSERPLYAWVVGVVCGVAAGEAFTTALRSHGSYVLWGIVPVAVWPSRARGPLGG